MTGSGRESQTGGRLTIYHIDAYRLSGPDDLHAIGWEEIVNDAGAIVVIEWAARIERALPPHCTRINFEHAGDTHRRLTINAPPALLAALQLKDE